MSFKIRKQLQIINKIEKKLNTMRTNRDIQRDKLKSYKELTLK